MGNNEVMKSFLPRTLERIRFHPSTTWFLSQCAEARGMQEVWKKIKPETLKQLRESAIIQSSESSNRIEGVEVDRGRLIPLVLGKTRPRDRSEQEIVGYRKALIWIHGSHSVIKIEPATILKIHELAQGGLISDAGKWKTKDNEIIEILQNGERKIRFKCVSAKETPRYVEQLCLSYRDTVNQSKLPELISIFSFVFDFLCIHPFRDGNGRTSRLLNLLLLYQSGFEVGRYISIERLIESTKDDYYKILAQSSEGWHESKHDLIPWWNYSLSILKSAYQELKERVERSTSGDTKGALIRQMVFSVSSPFTVAELCKEIPGINRELVKKVLFKMKTEKIIELIGKGRGAKWRRVSHVANSS